MTQNSDNITAIKDFIEILSPIPAVIELRALNTRKGPRSGYYDDFDQLLESVWNAVSGVQPVISPNELYARLSSIESDWMDYRAAHCPEEDVGSIVTDDSPSNSHVADEVELFERLMGHVKELVAITPA